MTVMDFQTFWYADEQFPLDPGATEAELNEVEMALRIKLPDAYKQLLRISNGGIPNYSGVPLPVQSPEGESHAIFIGGLRGTTELMKSPAIVRNWEMPKDLILISGNCHHNIALRLSNAGCAVVYYEADSETVIELAKSFDDFLEMLEPSE